MMKFVIDLSEMTNLESQVPSDKQQCSVAVFTKAGELLSYTREAEWLSYVEDWWSSGWLAGGEYSMFRRIASDDVVCLWKPAPCSE